MDAVYCTRNTVFAATAGAKTVLKLITPTGFFIKIHEIGVSTDGVTATAVPATLNIFTSDETTAGTNVGTAVTTQIKGRVQAHGLTVGQNMSAEGTTYTVLKHLFVPQFMGVVIIQNPLGLEEESPGSDAADSIGLQINVSANVNVLAWIKWSRG
jgi:hypothetical protein